MHFFENADEVSRIFRYEILLRKCHFCLNLINFWVLGGTRSTVAVPTKEVNEERIEFSSRL